ncbi:MAG: diaminopimelate epimerase [Deltaproteobacteria bacterium]|nr:MAG: diaminopimelate epimerase [Deltaproteobacteria bacterium]
MDINFPVSFTKMNGAGNDFIFIDHRHTFLDQEQKAEMARKICRRCFSVGADGLIFIENSEQADFAWDFYNADGSAAGMCGNGGRCAARYAYHKGITGPKMSFATRAGLIKAEVLDDGNVRLEMTNPCDFRKGKPVKLGGIYYEVWFVDTGVPHAVIFTENEGVPVGIWGRQVRNEDQFKPHGANVSFVAKRADGSFRSRTYERGVEDETRACGTGAAASALYAAIKGLAEPPVNIITSGGDLLEVSFDLCGDGLGAENLTMKGPARFVYEGILTEEILNL